MERNCPDCKTKMTFIGESPQKELLIAGKKMEKYYIHYYFCHKCRTKWLFAVKEKAD